MAEPLAVRAQASISTTHKLKQGGTPVKTLKVMTRNLAIISVLTLLAVAPTRGEEGRVLSANVPFSFDAGDKSLPAGNYQFEFRLGEQVLLVRGEKIGEIKLPFVSVLAGASLYSDVGLVFNTYHKLHVLSEVWIPGEGGVLVKAAPKEYTREMVIAVVSGAGPQMSGKEIFERTCARCHGPQGRGNPAAEKFFNTSIPRLDSAHIQTKSDQELRDIISHGRRQMDPVRMQAATVQHLLYPESVDAVIAYVRTLKPQP